MNTKNCVACGRPAISWSGHIHTEIGTIAAGWCGSSATCANGGGNGRPRVGSCTSVNKNSCSGYFDLKEVPLREELNEENLMAHARQMEYSNMINAMVSGRIPIDYNPNNPKKQRTTKQSFWQRLFS